MLTDNEINTNKEFFISLLDSIEREGFDKEKLINKLEMSDFFYAPASTQYNGAFQGGLCQHCLNVYDILYHIVLKEYPYKENKILDKLTEDEVIQQEWTAPFSAESVLIVALFHDFYKMNYFKEDVRNKKLYSLQGKKYDELGNYDWVSEKCYKVREPDERFMIGTDGQTSEYMTHTFIPLTLDESVAIINAKGGMDNDSARGTNLCALYEKYPLAALLHSADLIATFVEDKKSE